MAKPDRLDGQEVLDWKEGFLENVRRNPTTLKAWREIERKGFAAQAEGLLFWYAFFDRLVPRSSPLRVQTKRVAALLKRARRAYRVAEERAHDPRAELFARRRDQAVLEAALVPWFMPAVPLFRYPEIRRLPLPDAARSVTRAAESVRRYGAKLLLRVLRDCAAARGVRLGLGTLVAVAECADETRPVHRKTLWRFFHRTDPIAPWPLPTKKARSK